MISKIKKTREQTRNERAELVCRELRYQIAANIFDPTKLCDFLLEWMKVAKNNKYIRP